MVRDEVLTIEGLGQRVTVRGFTGLGGYTENRLTLLLEDGQVTLEGTGIFLERLGEGEIVATGRIKAVLFEG